MPVEIWYLRDDPDAWHLSLQLRDLLKIAKWEGAEPIPIPATTVERYVNQPSAAGVGSDAAGVTLVVRMVKPRNIHDLPPPSERLKDPDWYRKELANPTLWALHDALLDSLGQMHVSENDETAPAAGIIRIVVGPKPVHQ